MSTGYGATSHVPESVEGVEVAAVAVGPAMQSPCVGTLDERGQQLASLYQVTE